MEAKGVTQEQAEKLVGCVVRVSEAERKIDLANELLRTTMQAELREAGAVLLGKLGQTEGAFADHHPQIPPPVNPWGEALWPGASSSGSGVATAAELCFGSLGTDTGGSIRFPSAANGITGLKPTWGRVSRYGAFELAASLDHIGPMTRSAADAGAMLAAIDDPLLRESAVAALGAIGSPRGLPSILRACTDKPAIRRRAVLALAPFDGPEVDAAIEAARHDRDWQVRQAAEDIAPTGGEADPA